MPKPRANSAVELTDPVALRAYAHPVRMRLVGLLRREGAVTATQAAGILGESVPTCSFHLRQLARYGLVERAPGADARERPWRATALSTRWGHASADAETQAAIDHLDAVLMRQYYERAVRWLEGRDRESAAWRATTGPSDALLFVTPRELTELLRKFDALVEEYLPRRTDPAARPRGARPVNIAQFVITLDESARS